MHPQTKDAWPSKCWTETFRADFQAGGEWGPGINSDKKGYLQQSLFPPSKASIHTPVSVSALLGSPWQLTASRTPVPGDLTVPSGLCRYRIHIASLNLSTWEAEAGRQLSESRPARSTE